MNVLIIGDTHCPAMHPGYIAFLKRIEKKYNCNRVVHIGDLVDWNAISFHEKDPNMPSALDEYKAAKKQVKALHKAFPKADYMIGNHSCLPSRKAKTVGLLDEMLVPYGEFWGLDGWTIHDRYDDFILDGVIYRHGDKEKGGQFAALPNAEKQHMSLVQGHFHAQQGIIRVSNHSRVIFAMQTGCGVLPGHPAMKYSRVYSARPIVGCGVVANGKPHIEIMDL